MHVKKDAPAAPDDAPGERIKKWKHEECRRFKREPINPLRERGLKLAYSLLRVIFDRKASSSAPIHFANRLFILFTSQYNRVSQISLFFLLRYFVESVLSRQWVVIDKKKKINKREKHFSSQLSVRFARYAITCIQLQSVLSARCVHSEIMRLWWNKLG